MKKPRSGTDRHSLTIHVLITGGLGFIGAHLAARFCLDKHRVSLIARNSHATPAVDVSGASIVSLDLLDDAAVAAIDLEPADCLIHLAGPSSGMERLDDPDGILADGHRGTSNALALAARLNVKKFLYASSVAVYGEPARNPVLETDTCQPVSPYGVGKLANEKLVQTFCLDNDISFNQLRLAAVYGPGQDLARTTHGMVNIFLAQLLKGPAITSMGSLDRFRDIIHIDDAIEACFSCATRDTENGPLNICSGSSITVERLIQVLASEIGIGTDLEINVADGVPGDIHGIFADMTKMKSLLNFTPKFAPEEGLRHYARWVIDRAS